MDVPAVDGTDYDLGNDVDVDEPEDGVPAA
jgi:hypothetical protein